MPRGNDPSAAKELAEQFGAATNAETLIKEHDEGIDVELIKASNKPLDMDATAAIDLDAISPKYGGVVAAAAVRGGRMIVVEQVGGQMVKWHTDPQGGAGKRASALAKQEAEAQAEREKTAERTAAEQNEALEKQQAEERKRVEEAERKRDEAAPKKPEEPKAEEPKAHERPRRGGPTR